jgi:hypothetical protein
MCVMKQNFFFLSEHIFKNKGYILAIIVILIKLKVKSYTIYLFLIFFVLLQPILKLFLYFLNIILIT